MKKHLLTILSLCAVTISFGQETFKKNYIYLEAAGNGLFGSANYERQLTKKPGLGARIGIGIYSEDAFYLTIPVGINYLFKLNSERSFIEAGLGVTWTRIDGRLFLSRKNAGNDNFTNFIPGIGYRRHGIKDIMYRISLTPIANRNGLYPWLGVSIGKNF